MDARFRYPKSPEWQGFCVIVKPEVNNRRYVALAP